MSRWSNPDEWARLCSGEACVIRNWATFQELAARPEVSGRPFVLTTTNREGAEEYTGSDIIELLLKPYDIGQFISAVKEALSRSSPQPRARTQGTSAETRSSPELSS
jgi:hypothetical protein